MTCKNCQKRLSAYLDQELSPAERSVIEQHISECTDCAQALRDLQMLVDQATALPQKHAPDRLWGRIASELDQPNVSRIHDTVPAWRNWLRRPMPVVQLGFAIAILVVGMLVGRYILPPQSDTLRLQVSQQSPAELAALNVRASHYLERSKMLLVGIANLEPHGDERIDLSLEKAYSVDLLREADFLQEKLPAGKNERLRRLVAELELVLLEIANLEAESDFEHVDLLKSGIEQTDLLFKINLSGLNEEKPAKATAASGRQL